MKIYDRAPESVCTRVRNIIEKWHPDLKASNAVIDVVSAQTDGEHAVMLHGHPCYAVVRITNPKERAMGRGDAEIVFDRAKYEALTSEQQDALLDHELYHLKVDKDKFGAFQLDDHRRPKLKMRQHDRQFGWFDVIASRHGADSIEVQQAREFEKQVGQLYLFADDDSVAVDQHQ